MSTEIQLWLYRTIRGGCWVGGVREEGRRHRAAYNPTHRRNNLGLRLVRRVS